jgi:hypothetical protein
MLAKKLLSCALALALAIAGSPERVRKLQLRTRYALTEAQREARDFPPYPSKHLPAQHAILIEQPPARCFF